MNDVDDRLRELFDRKASEVPPHGTVPRTLRRRARRRIALNGIAVAAVVVALGGGALGTLSVLDRATTNEPNASSNPKPAVTATGPTASARPATSPTPATSPASSGPVLAACAAGQLRVDAELEGAMGSLDGRLVVSNYSSAPCTLQGRPTLTLLDDQRHAVDGVDYERTAPYWKVNREPTPNAWPVVTLRPDGVARVRLRWSNWCGTSAPLWQLSVPAGQMTQVYGMDAYGTPPCNGQDQPSTVEIGPFEPQP